MSEKGGDDNRVYRLEHGEIMPLTTLINRLRSKVEQLLKTMHIDCVYLYGSYAKGCPRPYSDIDLIAVSPDFGKDIIGEGVMLMNAFEDVSIAVEPRAYSHKDYEEAESGTFLYEEVIKKGIRIY